MSVDYSRFYLVGSNLTGYQLYCLDCDENDLVPFGDSEDDPLDLGQMVRAADHHTAEKHPDVQEGEVETEDLAEVGDDHVCWPLPPGVVVHDLRELGR